MFGKQFEEPLERRDAEFEVSDGWRRGDAVGPCDLIGRFGEQISAVGFCRCRDEEILPRFSRFGLLTDGQLRPP